MGADDALSANHSRCPVRSRCAGFHYSRVCAKDAASGDEFGLKILDPIWTTAYVVRNHGYMIYDALFATDANGEILCDPARGLLRKGRHRCSIR